MLVTLVAYNNEVKYHWFPIGLASIAASLEAAGHEVDIYQQDVNRYSPEHLTAHIDQVKPDVVGLGVVSGPLQYRKCAEVRDALRITKKTPLHFVLGGHGPSATPEHFLRKFGACAIVIGEGEETMVELVNAWEAGVPIIDIAGIAFIAKDGQYQENERRPIIEDLDNDLPRPAYHLFDINYYRLVERPQQHETDFVMPILSGRGCPYKCTFCYRMDPGFRARCNDAIIAEMKFLQDTYRINYFVFIDELLMSSPRRTKSLCRAIIDADLGVKWWCSGRLNHARPDVLKLMEEAGCVFINYGIEAVDDEVLRLMHKNLTVDQIIRGVEATLETSISPGLNMLWGNLGDNKDTLEAAVAFLEEYQDTSQLRTIRPVCPYPGTALYQMAIEMGLLEGPEDFYERKHLNSDLFTVNFMDIPDDKAYDMLFHANALLIQKHFARTCDRSLLAAHRLYRDRADPGFRGFRDTGGQPR